MMYFKVWYQTFLPILTVVVAPRQLFKVMTDTESVSASMTNKPGWHYEDF